MENIASTETTATSPLLRRINALAVLDNLRDSGAVTATEVMAATGLSRPTVHTVCEQLIGLGWVNEVEGRRPAGPGRPGRRNRCYEFNSRAGYVLGIDLGATSITVRLSNLSGEQVAEETKRFRHEEQIRGRDRITQTRRVIKSVILEAGIAGTDVLAAGVGVAAPVGPAGLAHHMEHYLPGLTGSELLQAIGRGYAWPVLLGNDADLAVLAEHWRGVAAGMDNVVVLLAGERLGAGLFMGGRLIRGHDHAAGEMGFLYLVNGVGNTDGIASLARRLGSEAVAGAVSADGRPAGTEVIRMAAGDPERVEAEMVFAAARNGDQIAIGIVAKVAERMARVIGILATLLNPEAVVLAGAIAPSIDVLLPPLAQRLGDHTHWPPQILATALGDHGVVIGATRLAIDHVESELFERMGTAP